MGTAQWLVELEQELAPVAEPVRAGQMVNPFTNTAGEAANLSERMDDVITSISSDSRANEGDYYIYNSKQLNSKQLTRQIARRERQEDSRYSKSVNEVLEMLAADFYHSGLQDLEAQWLGPVPPEAVRKYKETCMRRARALFEKQAKPGTEEKHRESIERKKRPRQRREVKLQKRLERERNLSATSANNSPHHAPSPQAHYGTHNLLLPTEGADIDMDASLIDDTDFDLPAHKPAFQALRSSSGYSLRRKARPTPPTQMRQEAQQEGEGGASSAEFELRVGLDKMDLQEQDRPGSSRRACTSLTLHNRYG